MYYMLYMSRDRILLLTPNMPLGRVTILVPMAWLLQFSSDQRTPVALSAVPSDRLRNLQ